MNNSRDNTQLDDGLRELYQDLILDHGRHPRNFRVPLSQNCEALGHNPLCGDKLVLYLEVSADGKTINDIGFQGNGCAISMASASMMTEMVKGKSVAFARRMFDRFHSMCTSCGVGGGNCPLPACDDCDERLAALAGVRHYPVRVKCATLPWHTMVAALARDENKKIATKTE